ncbi:hypothetical protein PG996_006129 [Apiospora saccharicola]|uniref:Uncharacterized protein n=1 Tax=Apiospora saccharicola TaxID=335842 RepID=A0ABR1VNF4_9PEZI
MPSREMGIVVICNAASRAKNLVSYRIMYDLLGVEESKRFDFEEKGYSKLTEVRTEVPTGRKAKPNLVDGSRKRLYPHVPEPPLLPSAALDKHTGRYRDPGYGDFIVALVCDGDDSGDGGLSESHIPGSEPPETAAKGASAACRHTQRILPCSTLCSFWNTFRATIG